MDQIITLLSNLFNLTKVASVTLPGLTLAGALALFLWPPRPIDTIRVPAILPPPSSLSEAEMPCADLPLLENGNLTGPGQHTTICKPITTHQNTRGSCTLTSVALNSFNDQQNFADTVPQAVKDLCQTRARYEDQNDASDTELSNAVSTWCKSPVKEELASDLKSILKDADRISRAGNALAQVCTQPRGRDRYSMRALRTSLKDLCNTRLWLFKWPFSDEESLVIVTLAKRNGVSIAGADRLTLTDVLPAMEELRGIATESGRFPWQANVVKQFVLDKTKDLLVSCNDRETAWLGEEQADNDQLKTDIANMDKQRSDLQDAYLASLKTNDRVTTENFRRKLSAVLELSNGYRARSEINLISINERTRRLDENKHEEANVNAILAEPGNIRALQGFDIYIQGLVNHVVGFILLSIALSVILVAFDRTVLGNLFEDVFPGW